MALASFHRYVAAETAVSVVISTGLAIAPTLLTFGRVDEVAVHDFARSVVPLLFMSAFMSGLIPSLLTRWRSQRRLLKAGLTIRNPSLALTVLIPLLFAITLTISALVLVEVTLPRLIGNRIGAGAALLLQGTYGALAASVVTPAALLLLFVFRGTSGAKFSATDQFKG